MSPVRLSRRSLNTAGSGFFLSSGFQFFLQIQRPGFLGDLLLRLHVSGLQVLPEDFLKAQYHIGDDQPLPQGYVPGQDSFLHLGLSCQRDAELGDEPEDLFFAFLILVHEPPPRVGRGSTGYDAATLPLSYRGIALFRGRDGLPLSQILEDPPDNALPDRDSNSD